jgi:hypothetical protein
MIMVLQAELFRMAKINRSRNNLECLFPERLSMAISQTPSQTNSSPETVSSQTIASHIPFLRRFSRVLTGNQPGGDAYVIAALEAIIENAAGFAAAGGGRTALYRFFLKVWGSIPLPSATSRL